MVVSHPRDAIIALALMNVPRRAVDRVGSPLTGDLEETRLRESPAVSDC
jgi:hypothetical protein